MKKMLKVLFLFFALNTPFLITGGNLNEGLEADRVHNFVEYTNMLNEVRPRIKARDTIAYHDLDSIPIRSPINTTKIKRISSDYGYRLHPIKKYWHKHTGIDITATLGTKVLSTAKGIVIKVEKSYSGYGNQVVIQHANGYKTRYAHLNDINVENGQIVDIKTVIGTVGNTGLTTGVHLHYEILRNNLSIDPMFFSYNYKTDRSRLKYFGTLIALEKG